MQINDSQLYTPEIVKIMGWVMIVPHICSADDGGYCDGSNNARHYGVAFKLLLILAK